MEEKTLLSMGSKVESISMIMMDYTAPVTETSKKGNLMPINYEYINTGVSIKEDSLPDYFGIAPDELQSAMQESPMAAATDNRRLYEAPQKITPYTLSGLVTSVFKMENGETVTVRSTGWKFATDWVMTAAHSVFDPARKVFADTITFQPALSGYGENEPYPAITIDRALIHPSYERNATAENPTNIADFACLLLNPQGKRPSGYLGFYYQYGFYEKGESFVINSYPSDLPADATDDKKGTYMYYQQVRHDGTDAGVTVVYDGIRTPGDDGAAVWWIDYAGKLNAVGILGMDMGTRNQVIRFTGWQYSIMRYLKHNYEAEMSYIQPPKPSAEGMTTIQELLPLLRKIEAKYLEYHDSSFSQPADAKDIILGMTRFLRNEVKNKIVAWNMISQVEADGKIGEETLNAMPSLKEGSSASRLVSLLQCALSCNAFPTDITGTYTAKVSESVRDFQESVKLIGDTEVTAGEVNRRTWSALLQSKGDPARKANACDCAVRLNAQKAQKLKTLGYNWVGRYLSSQDGDDTTGRFLTVDEIQSITDAGMKIFAIYQGDNTIGYYTYEQGTKDAAKAYASAQELHIPLHDPIYFGVAYDFTEQECRTTVKQYFQGIADTMEIYNNCYSIGIYAPRNTSRIIREEGLAESILVSGKSPYYSGNLGFALPDGWAFDQYGEESIETDGITFQVDKVIASGVYEGFDANTRCGHDGYRDCTLHDMVPVVIETSEGNKEVYYECRVCGYRVKAPYLQDSELLDKDKQKVIYFGYTIAAYFSALVEAKKYTGPLDLVGGVIKSMYMYRGKHGYEYCDSDGCCLPETGLFASEPGKKPVIEPSLSGYKTNVSGTVLDVLEIGAALSKAVLGIFSPEADFIFSLEGLTELVADTRKLQDKGLSYLLQLMAKGTDSDAIGLILSLIDVGIDVSDEGNINDYINVGDYLVFYDYSDISVMYRCQAVFDKDSQKVKAIVYDYKP